MSCQCKLVKSLSIITGESMLSSYRCFYNGRRHWLHDAGNPWKRFGWCNIPIFQHVEHNLYLISNQWTDWITNSHWNSVAEPIAINQITFAANYQQYRNDEHNFFRHIATIVGNCFGYANKVQFFFFISSIY